MGLPELMDAVHGRQGQCYRAMPPGLSRLGILICYVTSPCSPGDSVFIYEIGEKEVVVEI